MSRVLIVEDEQHIADGLRFNLEAEGHEATIAPDGTKALALLLKERRPFDVIILDVMLPGKDGFAVASELRAAGHYVPILMLTARGSAEDVLRGFGAGADDYLPKPFDLSILLARVNGLLRRRHWNEETGFDFPAGGLSENQTRFRNGDFPAGESSENQTRFRSGELPDVYTFSGRTLDLAAMEVRASGKAHRLTVMECDLLRYLVKNAGQPVSRRAILQDVWGLHESVNTRAIDNFIVRLRRYIEDSPAAPKFLQTVRGVGYRFVPQP